MQDNDASTESGSSGAQEASVSAAEPPIINIQGEKVALGPMRRDQVAITQRWMNDFNTLQLAGFILKPRTLEQQITLFERELPADEARFLIYEVSTWQPIGFARLNGIDLENRTAEFGIYIGEPSCRGKGYGAETTRLILDYAFTARGLHSVYLMTYEYNVAGQRAYAKAGFRECGRRRQCHMMGGRMWDVIYMDCLASEFTSPVLGRIFLPDKL